MTVMAKAVILMLGKTATMALLMSIILGRKMLIGISLTMMVLRKQEMIMVHQKPKLFAATNDEDTPSMSSQGIGLTSQSSQQFTSGAPILFSEDEREAGELSPNRRQRHPTPPEPRRRHLGYYSPDRSRSPLRPGDSTQILTGEAIVLPGVILPLLVGPQQRS